MSIEQRITELGLELPQPMSTASLPLIWSELMAITSISGHVPTDLGGRMCGPFGKVGDQVSAEEAYAIAGTIALGLCASLQAYLGDLDRIPSGCASLAWLTQHRASIASQG